MKEELLNMTIKELIENFSWAGEFFIAHKIEYDSYLDLTFAMLIETLGDEFYENSGTSKEEFINDFLFINRHMDSMKKKTEKNIQSLTILPGYDKSGIKEPFSLKLKAGEVTAIVGPTGSGKSRLLEDIECLAQEDTPTRRQILVNNYHPANELRFNTEESLIAQLSQNMNFVMDLSVEDFLTMHAESRMIENIPHIVNDIFDTANRLAGEKFSRETSVTQLSGGQSRALMIADTALLSSAPIILIDEIENAGVDKVKSLDLLVSNQKIVLISTHDPVLALSAHQRIIIKNGGIHKVIETSENEKEYLVELKRLDNSISNLRQKLRMGEEITDTKNPSSGGFSYMIH